MTQERVDSFLLQRSVDYLIPKILDAQFPELKAAEHIPVAYDGGPGAETISQLIIEYAGRAQVTSTPGKNPPLVGLLSNGLNSSVVRSVECAFEVHFQEARAAAMAGVAVSDKKGMAAREIVERDGNRLAYLGDQASGIYGLFTFPLLPKVISAVRFDDPAVSPTVLLDNLNAWSNLLYNTITRKAIRPNAVLMPSEVRTKLDTTYRSDHSDTTLMTLWRDSNKYIEYVDDVSEADEAGFNGTPAMIFYRKDPEYVSWYVPQPTEVLTQHESETSRTMLVHQRNAGAFFHRLSAIIIEGVLG